MEWKREEFSVRAYDQGYELKFRGQVIDRHGRQYSRNDADLMHIYGKMGQQEVDQIIFMGDTGELSPILRAAIIRVDAKWGTCRQCGKPFRRNSRGRPREFCDNGRCSGLWHTNQYRAKKGAIHIVLYTQADIVQHIRVFRARPDADLALEAGKAITADRDDEDCDMVICEME